MIAAGGLSASLDGNLVASFVSCIINILVVILHVTRRRRFKWSVLFVCTFRSVLAGLYAVCYFLAFSNIITEKQRAEAGLLLGPPSWVIVWTLPAVFVLMAIDAVSPVRIAEKAKEEIKLAVGSDDSECV